MLRAHGIARYITSPPKGARLLNIMCTCACACLCVSPGVFVRVAARVCVRVDFHANLTHGQNNANACAVGARTCIAPRCERGSANLHTYINVSSHLHLGMHVRACEFVCVHVRVSVMRLSVRVCVSRLATISKIGDHPDTTTCAI